MSKGKKNIRLAIIGICVLGFLIFIGIKIFNGFKKIQDSFAKDLPFTYSIPGEDSSLIAKKYLKMLKANKIIQSRERGPISLIFFDKEYHLIVYKIHVIKDTLLKDLLYTSNESVDRTTGKVYTVIGHGDLFEFQFQDAPANPVSKIYLTLAGDSLQSVVKNDSIIGYHLLCNNFSIRYAESGPIDIFVVGKEKRLGATAVIPMDLLFLKRNGEIYLLMMTPNSAQSTIAPDLLYNVVTGT